MKQLEILGTRIDPASLQDCLETIKNTILLGQQLRIVTANPELIYKAEHDANLLAVINSAGLVVPDGVGVVWAARKLDLPVKERVTGIDLTAGILRESNRHGWRVFLLGAKPGIAEKVIRQQSLRYPGIALACHHGFFTQAEEPEVIRQIRHFAPDILLVGLGAPKQEYWNHEHAGLAKVSMGIGGSFDVLSGEVKRAPGVFRESGLEWLYRLISEPGRIKRQVVLPLYLLRVLKQKYFPESDK
ncbi:WecB/TagA/CpsF family glycosyltransferase [Dehalobacter restrictus]|uniref:WecB/TagA/CpsF family glycosyltransferase n=1 Tax=Dehalobacter restrictus TaxID=55583 RepID=UPI0030156FCE